MDAGNADIVQAQDIVAESLRGHCRFLGDGDIARAAGGDDNTPLAARLGHFADYADARHAVILKRQLGFYILRRLFGQAGYEHGMLLVFEHCLCDTENMLLGLALAVYDLGHALADAAVVIHLGVVAYLLKRLHFKLKRRIIGA